MDMRAAVLSLVAVVMVACGGSNADGLELDANGQPVRQCAVMQRGIYRVQMQNVSGNGAGCSLQAWTAVVEFGGQDGSTQTAYSADGCQVTVRSALLGTYYSYDLQVEPDGQSAHGTGTMRSGAQCDVQFSASVVERLTQ